MKLKQSASKCYFKIEITGEENMLSSIKMHQKFKQSKCIKLFLNIIKYCFHVIVFANYVFFVLLSIWGIFRKSSKYSVSFTEYQISHKLEMPINVFITFPIKMNANSISMENAETKIKCQKQQFLSKMLLGLMTFCSEKKSFQKQSALQTI